MLEVSQTGVARKEGRIARDVIGRIAATRTDELYARVESFVGGNVIEA